MSSYRIDAKVGMGHDYLEVSMTDSPPVIVRGRQYLGNVVWQSSDIQQNKESLLLHTGEDFTPKSTISD